MAHLLCLAQDSTSWPWPAITPLIHSTRSSCFHGCFTRKKGNERACCWRVAGNHRRYCRQHLVCASDGCISKRRTRVMAVIYVPRVFGGVLIITYTPSTQQTPINATWVARDLSATWKT